MIKNNFKKSLIYLDGSKKFPVKNKGFIRYGNEMMLLRKKLSFLATPFEQ